jgi:hypothetical protein
VSASLALLRHAPTAWNLERRLQGRADVPLAPEGRAQIRRRRVPPPWSGWRALASPLARCVETMTLDQQADVSIGCQGEHESRCPRSVRRELPAAQGVALAP